jgi:uncharacterized protein (TIGR00661 family)
MKASKSILICPLDWGLGHASRCCPIIDKLNSLGHRVILGADGRSLEFLKLRYPELEIFKLESFPIRYSEGKSFSWGMAKQVPALIKSIEKEHRALQKFIQHYQPDLIISDNRYGLYSDKIRSILITHQLNPMTPLPFRSLSRKYIESLCEKFDDIWVPDLAGAENLSGALSHHPKSKLKAKYIGPLSRFNQIMRTENPEISVFAMISGPEPTRSNLESQLIKILSSKPGNHILVCGKPEWKEVNKIGNLSIYPHLQDEELAKHIQSSETIIMSGGYSGIMDLYRLGRGAYLIPSPGQPEQEYLATHLNEKYGFSFLRQGDLNESLQLNPSSRFKLRDNSAFETHVLQALEMN